MEQDLIAFCSQETTGRDESHGVEHMKCFNYNTKIITADINLDEHTKYMVTAVALFHDINNHKYYSGNELTEIKEKMKHFLLKYFPEDTDSILFIIENISFSKDKNGQIPWETFTEKQKLIRDIVSDVDKLEAIGKTDIERCKEYTSVKLSEKNLEINDKILFDLVKQHCDEKLFKLST